MNYKVRDNEEMLIRAVDFFSIHPGALNPAVAPLVPQINACLGEIGGFRTGQVEQEGVFRSGAGERRRLAAQLRQTLLDLSRNGRIIAKKADPGLRDQLRLGRKMSYSELEARAAAFVSVLTPIKAAFVARGFPADFLTEVTALVLQLKDAHEAKLGGVSERVRNTLGLTDAARRGVAIVRDLDAMVTMLWRKSDPVLLSVWKTTIRLRSRKKRNPTAETNGVKPDAQSVVPEQQAEDATTGPDACEPSVATPGNNPSYRGVEDAFLPLLPQSCSAMGCASEVAGTPDKGGAALEGISSRIDVLPLSFSVPTLRGTTLGFAFACDYPGAADQHHRLAADPRP